MTQTKDGRTNGNLDDPAVQRALEVMSENESTWNEYVDQLDLVKNLVRQAFVAREPEGAKRMAAYLILQIILKLQRKTTRPTFTLKSNRASKDQLASMRAALLHWMDVGGYKEVLTDKPGAYQTAYLYGNGPVRIGLDEDDDFAPIKFDNIEPDQIFLDANAVAMRTKRGSRQVTRMLVIYTYDFDQAKAQFPGVDFEKGSLPKSMRAGMKLEKGVTQQSDAAKKEVEIGYFYDIGGEKPVFTVIAGRKADRIDHVEGSKYPFIWDNSKKPYIPVDIFKNIKELEGFWDVGWGQIAYALDRIDQIMNNKMTQNAITSLSDRSILNVGEEMGGEIMRRIEDADSREAKTGSTNVIINDLGEPITVSNMQQTQVDQAKVLVQETIYKVLRRLGINIDITDRSAKQTLGQDLLEEEDENAVVKAFMELNTPVFKFFPEATMDLARQHIKKGNDNLIPTFKIQKREVSTNDLGEVEIRDAKTEFGEPIEEEVNEFTYTMAADLFREFPDTTVEINTNSGITKSDRREVAKAVTMKQISGEDPNLVAQATRSAVRALGFDEPDELQMQPELAGAGSPSQQGLKNLSQDLGGAPGKISI